MDKKESVFHGMIEESELIDLANADPNGGWEIIGSITSIIGITYIFCPTVPCSNTGYCKG